MPTGDVQVGDVSTTSYYVISSGGPQGAWTSPASNPMLLNNIVFGVPNELGLRISMPRCNLISAQLTLTLSATSSTSPIYLGVVNDQAFPGFGASPLIDLAGNRIQVASKWYPVEFHPAGFDGTVNADNFPIDLAAWKCIRGLLAGPPTFQALYVVFTSTFPVPAEIVMSATSEGGTPSLVPRLSITGLVPAQGLDDEVSGVTGERYHERWFKCLRCGMWFPISRSVRDAEQTGLIVCDSGCADLRGRKNMKKTTKEREDRLWPRL